MQVTAFRWWETTGTTTVADLEMDPHRKPAKKFAKKNPLATKKSRQETSQEIHHQGRESS